MARFKNWFKRVFHHGEDAAVANGKPPTHPKTRKEYRNRSRDDVYRVRDDKNKVKNFREPIVVERISLQTESSSYHSRDHELNSIHEEEREEINWQQELQQRQHHHHKPQKPPIHSLQDFEDWINGDLSLGPDKNLPSWTNAGVSFNSWRSGEEDRGITSDKSSTVDSLEEILDNGTDSLEKFLDELPSFGSKSSQVDPLEDILPRELNIELPVMESKESDSPQTANDSLIEEIIKMLDAGVEPPGFHAFAGGKTKKKKKRRKYAADKSVQSLDDLVSAFESKSIFSEPPPRTQNPKWFTMEALPTSPPPPPPPPRRPTRRKPLPYHDASPEGYVLLLKAVAQSLGLAT